VTERRRRTVGVEEELLLFDRVTLDQAQVGASLADPESHQGLPSVEHEFKRQQVETASRPQSDLTLLSAEIAGGRLEVARRAADRGAAPAALATDPTRGRPQPTKDSRYGRMLADYGAVAESSLTNGMHVHVSIESRAEGVAVIDRIRPWLPTLVAMSANSPYHQGRDTSYASYREVCWGMWPTAGPTELFGSLAAYERTVQDLVATGAALDEAMIYFAARLAIGYPTVEIRVMDVTPTTADAVVLAGVCRALVETAARDAAAGRAPLSVGRLVLRAAGWRAARFGLTGELVQPDGGGLVPAAGAVEALVAHVADALAEDGDTELVERGVQRLFAQGTGADRQRRVFGQRGAVADIVAAALDWTVEGTA
jgi:carboxylate-amine ligase